MVKHRKLKHKAKISLLFFLTVVIASIGYWFYRGWMRSNQTDVHIASTNDQLPSDTLGYDGIQYTAKEKVHSYLFIGIDKKNSSYANKVNLGGQADVQLLMVVDDVNKTWQLLQINRDSIVDVQELAVDGSVADVVQEQICLAHAYGDGGKGSCINTVNAVSAMLDNQHINGYVALNLDGIPVINDDLGGVTVTVKDDFSEVDPTLIQGQTITLNGNQARNYVSGRGNIGDQTNLSRMARQREYMSGLLQKLGDMDAVKLTKMVSDAGKYLTTGISITDMVDLMLKMKSYEDLGLITIDGTSKTDDNGFNAYYLNEDSLRQAILKLYYEPYQPAQSTDTSN